MAHTPASMPNPEGTPSHGCGNVVWSHLIPTTISTMTRISKGRRIMCLTIPTYDEPNCLSLPGFMFGTVAPIPPHLHHVRQPTAYPSSHPVRLRPTHRGAGVVQGVKVERAAVRTTLTPWAAPARLCLGRRWSGWEPHDARPAPAGTHEPAPLPSRSLSAPAGGIVLKPPAWFSTHAPRAYTAGARRNGDPRAQSDRGHDEHLRPRRPGHSARGRESPGPDAEAAASRPWVTAPVDVSSRWQRPPTMIGWRPLHWWARAVSNCRHLLCKSSALPLSYAPVDEGTAYMDYSPWSQTVAGGSGPAATALVRAAHKGRHGGERDGG